MKKIEMVDVLVLGGGAAGMMCAFVAGKQGRRVVVLEKSNRVGKKILMSGGGRCNFTNMYTEPENYLSQNPHFCKSALKRFTPYDFLDLIHQHQVPYHEKKLGQLFCDRRSKDIVDLLLAECADANVQIKTHCHVTQIQKETEGFSVQTNQDTSIQASSVVVATGGLSIPSMGSSGFAYELAQQFGLEVVPTRAGLVPLTLDPIDLQQFEGLSGVSADTQTSYQQQSFRENILWTHRGLSGPAILQISSYWEPGKAIQINLMPDKDMYEFLKGLQQKASKQELKTILGHHLSKSIAHQLCEHWFESRPLPQYSHQELKDIANRLNEWTVKPSGSEGYRKAEVTLGGVDTNELSSKTMECKKVPGLYFIGEAVDVTGHLGGFNFQWAWASGHAAGLCV